MISVMMFVCVFFLVHVSPFPPRTRLEEINSSVPNAPCLIVGTHCDDKRCSSRYVNKAFEKLR